MATGSATWTGATDTDWEVDTNWNPNQHPADGDTATFDGTVGAGLPDTSLPGVGIIDFVFSGAHTCDVSALLDEASLGNLTISHADAVITARTNLAGSLVLAAGSVIVTQCVAVFGTTALGSTGSAALTVTAGHDFSPGASLTLYDGSTITIEGTARLVLGPGVSIAPNTPGIAVSIENNGEILGRPAFSGASCTWGGTGTITADNAGTLDLGTATANGQSVQVTNTSGTVTLGGNFACLGFTHNGNGGTFDANGKTVTVGTGGVTYTAGTPANAPSFTFAASGNLSWNNLTNGQEAGTITVNSGVTATLAATTVCRAVAGAGNLALGNSKLYIRARAANWWALTGTTTTGTGVIYSYYPDAAYAIAAAVNIPGVDLRLYGSAEAIQTFSGGLSCANLSLGYASTIVAGVALGSGVTHTISGMVSVGSSTGSGMPLAFGGTVFASDIALAGITPDFGSAIIIGKGIGTSTFDGTDSGTVANTRAIIAQATVTNLTAPAANPVYVYKHDAALSIEAQAFDYQPNALWNGALGPGNTNVQEVAAVALGGPLTTSPDRRRTRGRRAANTGRGRFVAARQ